MNEFIIKNGFRSQGNSEVTGSANISGSLSVISSAGVEILNTTASLIKDSNGKRSIDWKNRYLYDTSDKTSIYWDRRKLYDGIESQSMDWDKRTLQNVAGTSTLNWQSGSLIDSSAKQSIDWQTRYLYDASNKSSLDWTNRIAYDSQSSPSASVDWKNRLLKNNTGTTILDWQNATFTGTASFATQALSASYTRAAGSQGNIQFNNGGTFGFAASTELLYNTASRALQNGESVSAVGLYSHAQGRATIASGSYSHAEGNTTTSTGTGSHAEGTGTTANGKYSHTEGTGTTAIGAYSHTEGASTTTGNPKGYYATMTASGVFTISSSYGDLSGAGLFDAGNLIGVDDSQYNSTYTYINLTAASCSFNGTNTLVHVTDTTFLTSTASIGGITNFANNTGDQVWGGYAAHAQGNSTTAQGAYSHTEGDSSNAYGPYSHAEGSSNAFGEYSHAEGGGQASGQYSHAEGNGATYGAYSHAEGVSTTTGWRGYALSASIAAGVIKLLPVYGDRTTDFQAGSFVLIQDIQGEIVAGVKNTYRYEISGSAFTSSLTQITLYDTSVTTATNKHRIGVYGNSNPTSANVECGEGSHAEGYATTAYGDYSHTAGFGTQTVGWYQSVVGQGNIPLSSTSSFIVGNGSYDVDNDIWTRSNLLVAEGNTVQISGSLLMSGSLTISPTSSGTPAYTGKDGEIVFGQTGANYKIYVWLGGAWRSGSLS